MSISGKGVHVLVFPYPAQGHMLPMLDLTHHLANHGLTITVLVTPKNRPNLDPLLSTHPSIQTLVLPFPGHPSLPSGVENVRDLGSFSNLPIIAALANLRDPIIEWFRSHATPPVALLSDFFLGWTQPLARHLGIPRIAFFSSGALLASVADHLWHHFDTVRSLDVVNFPDLPRSPSFAKERLPSSFRYYRESDPDWEVARSGMTANSSSWASVFNTFGALEGEYLDHLKNKMGQDRIFGVGPIFLWGGADTTGPVASHTDYWGGASAWLDECPDGSVLYVCFGSQKFLRKAQMEALAQGLEASGARFVWVVKSGRAQQTEEVPDGFEGRVSGRGLVVKGWAPQVAVLSHRAVGGFLSHCGWNSTLEGIAGGAVILAWPMEADQHLNARLLVEYLGVAVPVCEGADEVPDSAELARIISESMSGNTSQRARAKELSTKASEAVKAGGSSCRDLDGLVRELAQLQLQLRRNKSSPPTAP